MSNTETQNGYGLVANASSRCWDVSLDESLEKEGEWIVEFENPTTYLSIRLEGADKVATAISFLDAGLDASPNERENCLKEPLTLGKAGTSSVSLIWDNEEFVRCFLVVGGEELLCVRISLLEDDVRILRQVLEFGASSL